MLLRIEDIDSPRVKSWAIQQAIDDLRWLGLDWDEGPEADGDHAPYIQTHRKHLYEEALLQLMAPGDLLFPCVCTRRDIEEAASAPHERIDGVVYPGTCAGWSDGDPLPEAFSWRLRCRDLQQSYDDQIAGPQKMNAAKMLGDFPVTRKREPTATTPKVLAGHASYQLAAAVDDIAMGVTEVFRGDDLIPSTFRQLEIYHALEATPPAYAHAPLVLGENGMRLAKRHGDTRLSYFREQGTRPETIVGWAAWSAGLIDTWEDVSASELVEVYDVAKIEKQRPTVTSEIVNRMLAE